MNIFWTSALDLIGDAEDIKRRSLNSEVYIPGRGDFFKICGIPWKIKWNKEKKIREVFQVGGGDNLFKINDRICPLPQLASVIWIKHSKLLAGKKEN